MEQWFDRLTTPRKIEGRSNGLMVTKRGARRPAGGAEELIDVEADGEGEMDRHVGGVLGQADTHRQVH